MADAGTELRPVDFDPFAPATAREVRLPLTEPQTEMWTAAAMSHEANCSYNQCFALTFHGPLRVESLRAALDKVVVRHDALRAVIAPDGTGLEVRPPFSVPMPLVDLSELDPANREREIEALVEQEGETPFDLAEGPLIRAFVVREAADRHRFVLTVHHIVCDGWSSSVLFSDLGTLYAADCVGIPAQLEPAASFRDYVTEQTSPDHVAAASDDEAYWAAQYSTGAPVLDLPLAGARPGTKTYRMGQEILRIDQELYAAIKMAGAKSGATLFATLLAAYEVLLHRLSGQSDFVVGIPFAGQAQLENPALVAHCVSTVPLRAALDPEATFVEHLRTVRQELVAAQDHSRATFGSVVRRLRIPRDASRTPLVAVTFNIDRIGAPFEFEGLSIASLSTPRSYSNFELAVNVLDSGSDLVVECDYNGDLFDRATILRWLSHYEVLLRGIVAEPAARLRELPVLTTDDVDAVRGWNQTDMPTPGMCVTEAIAAQASRAPDRVAVELDGTALSYRDLEEKSQRLAEYLAALGVRAGECVGVLMHRGPDLVVAQLAVLKAGGAYLPMDSDYPSERLAYMLEDSGATVLLTHNGLDAALPPHPARVVRFEDDLAAPGSTPTPPTLDDPAYLIYTSGSTGKPKGVVIPHRGLANLVAWHNQTYGVTGEDRATLLSGPSFDASVWETWPYLVAGATLCVPDDETRVTPERLVSWLVDRRITISFLATPLAEAALEVDWPPDTQLRALLTGGDRLSKRPRAGLPFTLFNHYGPTENSVVSTAGPVESSGDMPPPIGRPIGNNRTYVLDRWLQLVPVGVPGELYVGGVGLAHGYHRRPELTAERFIADHISGTSGERLYRTGDLARWRHDGEIEFLGRIDNQVKIRGFRIELGEIEANLAQHQEVKDAVVLAREDSPGDRRLVAYVVPRSEGDGLTERLRARLREALPGHMVPAHFVFLSAVPVTANGKVDRDALPAPDLEAVSAGSQYLAPRTPTESTIAGIFADALGIESPGVNDDFFDLGGDSLKAAQIVTELRAMFHVDTAMRHLFERPTIAGLAETVDLLAVLSTGAPEGRRSDREEIEI